MNRALGAALTAAAVATMLGAAPAQAKFAPPLGSLGQPPPPPGKLYNRNGVTDVALSVRNIGGAGGFAPGVSWSARNAKGKVTGKPCRIEVTFPGKRWPMYKSRACQGSANFPHRVYTSGGRYAITVQERLSGSFTTVPFIVSQ